MRRFGGLLVALSLAAGWGCRAPADQERLGDRAYAEGRWEAALSAYESVARRAPSGRVWAKMGAAALHAGDPARAVEAYRSLAAEDPTRTDEALDGLELAAREARQAGDRAALVEAVAALRARAPSRPLGRLALALDPVATVDPGERVLLLPQAIAAAPDAGRADSLLLAYAQALRDLGRCPEAAGAFGAVRRRAGDAALAEQAGPGLVECALRLGRAALAEGDPDGADRWFSRAAAVDSASDAGREALLGLGRARAARGDHFGAAEALRALLDASVERDSTHEAAEAELVRLLPFGPADDTLRMEEP